MARKKLPTFQTAFGTYTASSVIGQGGAGIVYAAVEEQGSEVAVKVLDPTKATPDRLRRFKNEFLFGFRNQHQHLVRVLDHGVDQAGSGAPFYVMPRYASSLRQLLQSGIAGERALALYAEILDGVEAAHLLRVVHRDLKPENVLVDPAGNLVVADFGVARFEEEELYTAVETRQNERLANFLYAAPEQRRRGTQVDLRADIFALGLMLNELFTSEVPQGAGYKTIAAVAPKSAWLDDVVTAMIQQAPASRPGGIAEVKELLRLRSDQFEKRQRLSATTQTVVPEGELDDPLITDPVRIVGVDYEHGTLIIRLSQPVNDRWVHALRNMGNYTSLMGAEPARFQIRGNEAKVGARDVDAQQIVDYFKDWLPKATQKYEATLREERRRQEEERQARAYAERQELERQERVRKSITF